MDREAATAVLDHLRGEFGGHLRSVALGEPGDHEVLYAREDVAEKYGDDEEADIRREAVFEAVDVRRQESLYELGECRCTVRVFEEGVVLHFHDPETFEGVVVSLDAAADPPVVSVARDCLALLGGDRRAES